MVAATATRLTGNSWVGTYWTEDGLPEPEATLLADREASRRWVLEDPRGNPPAQFVEQPWWLAATYSRPNGDEAYAVAWLGKVVETGAGFDVGKSEEEPKTTT